MTNPFCSWMLSLTLVGAVEPQPGWMELHHIDLTTQEAFVSHVYKADYLYCTQLETQEQDDNGDL